MSVHSWGEESQSTGIGGNRWIRKVEKVEQVETKWKGKEEEEGERKEIIRIDDFWSLIDIEIETRYVQIEKMGGKDVGS